MAWYDDEESSFDWGNIFGGSNAPEINLGGLEDSGVLSNFTQTYDTSLGGPDLSFLTNTFDESSPFFTDFWRYKLSARC